jgi:IclR family acetate operon transcriptional repressor
LPPSAADLLARFRETVDITFLDGDRALVIESLTSPQALRADSFVGARLTLHCTAHGKAHLSRVDPARRRELVRDSLERLTAYTQ